MANARPPSEVRLTPEIFPKEEWARRLIDAINQFSVETVRAINVSTTDYTRELLFATGASVADAFPMDIAVDGPPNEVRIARVISGAPAAGAVPAILWERLSGGRSIRVSFISGLAPSTKYRLALAIDR